MMNLKISRLIFFRDAVSVGSISAVFSSPVFDPPKGDFGVRAGLLPEWRLVIEPSIAVSYLFYCRIMPL